MSAVDKQEPVEKLFAGGVEDEEVVKPFRSVVGCTRMKYHFIRKCQNCQLYKTKNKTCFSMGHPARIFTVRVSEDECHFETLEGVKMTYTDGQFYYRIKPGSRLAAWNDGKIEEISAEDACALTTVCLAPGTTLQHAPRSQMFSSYLNNLEREALVDFVIPEMPKPRLMHSAGCGDKVEVDHSGLSRDVGDGESSHGRKRRKSSRKVAPSSARSSVAGGSSGGDGGRQRGDGAEENARDTDATNDKTVERSVPVFDTKSEVRNALAVKLKACEERELELRRLIDQAYADLEENDRCKKVAIQDSNAQILAIIEQREAYAAHCEELAAQARAQNITDRESLQMDSGDITMEDKPPPSAETTADTRAPPTALASTSTSASDRHENMRSEGGNGQAKIVESTPQAIAPSAPAPTPAAAGSPRVTATPTGPNMSDRNDNMQVCKEQGVQAAVDGLTGRAETPCARTGEASAAVAGRPATATPPAVSDTERGLQMDVEVVRTERREPPRGDGLPLAPTATDALVQQVTVALAAPVSTVREKATAGVDPVALREGSSESGNGGARLSSAPTATEPSTLLVTVAAPGASIASATDERELADRDNLQAQDVARNGRLNIRTRSASSTGAPVCAVAPNQVPCASERLEERLQAGDMGKASRSTRAPSPSQPVADKGASDVPPPTSEIAVGWGGGQQVGAAVSVSSPLPPTASMFTPFASSAGVAGRGGQQVATTMSPPVPPQASMVSPSWSVFGSSTSNAMRVASVPSVSQVSASVPPLSVPSQIAQYLPHTLAQSLTQFPVAPRPPGAGVAVSGSHQVGKAEGTHVLSARPAFPSRPSRVEEAVNDGQVNAAASVP